jgi:glucose-1-phosphate cytidylyltransferase
LKAVIFAGGMGSRISEDSRLKPKPMIEIGAMPFLWHIMKIYSFHGINDFVICLGYRGYVIKEYFANYFLHMSDVTFDMTHNRMDVHQNSVEPWRVTLIDTGTHTQTGGRLKRVHDYIGGETFCLTYGDGVADIDISAQLACHRAHGKLATVTAVQPSGRYGALDIDGGKVVRIQEKTAGDGAWTNGGFFVLEPRVLDYIEGDETVWEAGPLSQLAAEGQLMPYQHQGFWQPMDTLREKNYLEELWASGEAPWRH